MKSLRIVAVLLVVGAAAGYYYQTLSSNSTKTTTASSSNSTGEAPESADGENRSNSGEISANDSDEGPYKTRRADVLEVFDGDTLKVRFVRTGDVRRIRIKGIDCPESSEEVDKCWSGEDLIDIPCEKQVPLGKRATTYAKGLLADETVELESYSEFNEGEHGRTLAYVRTPDGRDYGLESVKKGYCKDSGVRYGHPRDDTYEKHRRGIKR